MFMSKYRLAVISTTILLTFAFMSCLRAQEQSFTMPQVVPSQLGFGISLIDFKKSADMSSMRVDNTRDWRTVYFQPDDDPEVKSLIYFFDNKQPGKPLYEITIQFLNEKIAQQNATLYFGTPNHPSEGDATSEEWRFEPTGTFAKWAWVYKDKIVIVARVPGTDWDEDWDENGG